MGHINVQGKAIYFAARGESGAPLVFVHGAGASHLIWNGQIAAFADVARTFAIDLPGHGRSKRPGRTSVLEYATVVRDWMDAMELERAIIVGISMGGAIAQTMALEFPERVQALGLVGTGAKLRVAPAYLDGIRTDFPSAARLLAENQFAPGANERLIAQCAAQLEQTGATVTFDDFAACDVFDMRGRVHEIAAPALVVCGREDRMTPLKFSEYLVKQLVSARLAVIEQAGHMTMVEQPGAFDEVVREWLVTL